jgi:hypothetical protein
MMKKADFKKSVPKSWLCDDCGTDLSNRMPTRDKLTDAKINIFGHYILSKIKFVRDAVWEEAGAEPDTSLCIDCFEKRLGRRLQPEDYTKERLEDVWPNRCDD